jgi:hypothetical protein
VRFGTGSKGRYFFVTDHYPLDGMLLSQNLSEAIERIADDSVDSLDACGR